MVDGTPTDEANALRDGRGPLPAELRRPLADLIDALTRWEWVGQDRAMDDFLRATPGLRDAWHVMRGALRGHIIMLDPETIERLTDGQAPTGPTEPG